jgi:hypothetical protein
MSAGFCVGVRKLLGRELHTSGPGAELAVAVAVAMLMTDDLMYL